eukprot:scaffold600_cov385-Prasinococcus_capsulatus_cf.AAC.14
MPCEAVRAATGWTADRHPGGAEAPQGTPPATPRHQRSQGRRGPRCRRSAHAQHRTRVAFVRGA